MFVRRKGLEPSRPCGHRHLKPARLPFRHLRDGSTIGAKAARRGWVVTPRDLLVQEVLGRNLNLVGDDAAWNLIVVQLSLKINDFVALVPRQPYRARGGYALCAWSLLFKGISSRLFS